jgi:hypothetical protein
MYSEIQTIGCQISFSNTLPNNYIENIYLNKWQEWNKNCVDGTFFQYVANNNNNNSSNNNNDDSNSFSIRSLKSPNLSHRPLQSSLSEKPRA